MIRRYQTMNNWTYREFFLCNKEKIELSYSSVAWLLIFQTIAIVTIEKPNSFEDKI